MEAVLLCSKVVPRATIWNRTGNFRSVISTNTLSAIRFLTDSKKTPLLLSFELVRVLKA
ncbi:unnamed protein product [Brassica napus]|uniref:(rape) hypothetical protein n=1 Tax=Brassica napus TaxID=3708 RepID=A0A816W412_BRANA|nr:unnamed protein product [Brassica napus]